MLSFPFPGSRSSTAHFRGSPVFIQGDILTTMSLPGAFLGWFLELGFLPVQYDSGIWSESPSVRLLVLSTSCQSSQEGRRVSPLPSSGEPRGQPFLGLAPGPSFSGARDGSQGLWASKCSTPSRPSYFCSSLSCCATCPISPVLLQTQ